MRHSALLLACSKHDVHRISPPVPVVAAVILCVLWLSSPFTEARLFTDRAGRTVEAELVAFDQEKSVAKLRAQNGDEMDVALVDFSASDQGFIKEWAAASAPGNALGGSGETIDIEFPDLPPDQNGAPAVCRVRLPEQYDPSKPVPLMLWFAGGKGSNEPKNAFSLVDPSEYAIAAMPYPGHVGRPKIAREQGQLDKIRDYHVAMLKVLKARLKNVHPQLRFVGGMSNGAHVVGTYISDGEREFVDYFNGYILIEGGTVDAKPRKRLRKRQAYLAWGDAPNNSRDFMRATLDCVEAAKMEVTTRTMPGVGHGFPSPEQAEVRKWIEQVAAPALLAEKTLEN
jgi:predicted esterase